MSPRWNLVTAPFCMLRIQRSPSLALLDVLAPRPAVRQWGLSRSRLLLSSRGAGEHLRVSLAVESGPPWYTLEQCQDHCESHLLMSPDSASSLGPVWVFPHRSPIPGGYFSVSYSTFLTFSSPVLLLSRSRSQKQRSMERQHRTVRAERKLLP